MTAFQSGPPRVSVIMANYNGEAYLGDAIESVLAQTLGDLELIFVDDCSPDSSVDIATRYAERDSRIKIIALTSNGGPGRARNQAIEAASGEWLAIVDSDDILHAERFERLLAQAESAASDAIADNLLYFSETDGRCDQTLLAHTVQPAPRAITAAHFVRSNSADAKLPALGYLKPLIRRDRLGGLRYDESVRIAEDYDFILRFLLGGAKLVVVSDPLYFYRRHTTSLSHRLSTQHLEAMIANHRALYMRGYDLPPSTRALLDYRLHALARGLAYERLVASLKSRDFVGAARHLVRQPAMMLPLARSLREHLERRSVIQKRREPADRVIQLAADASHATTPAARKLLDAYAGRDVETIIVPHYGHVGRDIVSEQKLWTRIAGAALTDNVTVIAHGLAGMYASSFMPMAESITALIDNEDDEPIALRWAGVKGTRIFRADGSRLVGAETVDTARSVTPDAWVH